MVFHTYSQDFLVKSEVKATKNAIFHHFGHVPGKGTLFYTHLFYKCT